MTQKGLSAGLRKHLAVMRRAAAFDKAPPMDTVRWFANNSDAILERAGATPGNGQPGAPRMFGKRITIALMAAIARQSGLRAEEAYKQVAEQFGEKPRYVADAYRDYRARVEQLAEEVPPGARLLDTFATSKGKRVWSKTTENK